MTQSVLCEVNSCKNWAKGKKCNADLIYVVNLKNKQPSEINVTGCKTFEPAAS